MAQTASKRGLSRWEILTLLIAVPVVIAIIIAAKPLVASILDHILHLNPTMVFVVVSLLVFAEAAVFFGFVFPGETAVILGGVVASGGRINVYALTACVVIAAILGDTVGYWVGREFGEKVLDIKLLANRRGGIDKALQLLAKRGALAVFIGRFTAFLRAVMPGLAGLSRLRYQIFLAANAAGALVWGVLFTFLGYWVGGAYRKAEKYAGWASTGILILVVFVAVGFFIRGRLKEKELESEFSSDVEQAESQLESDLEATRRALGERQTGHHDDQDDSL